jgi:hypothetical protein
MSRRAGATDKGFVTILLGNGDGTFKTGKSMGVTPIAVGDFNGDGKPSLVIQTSPAGTLGSRSSLAENGLFRTSVACSRPAF